MMMRSQSAQAAGGSAPAPITTDRPRRVGPGAVTSVKPTDGGGQNRHRCPPLHSRPSMTALRIAVLISGSGSNMSAIADHFEDRDDVEIGIVLSDRPDVAGLDRAEAAGLPTEVIDWRAFPNREAFTTAVCDAVEACGCTFMVLAGFMRILAPEAVERFPGRILNIHPSLLPSFPGAHAVEEALDHGVKVTGVTIHVVDELVDNGPILAQEAIDVLDGDDAETLHARIQAVEHRLYPRVVADFVLGRLEQR